MLFGCDHATKIAAKTVLEDAAPVQLAPGVIELRYVPNPDIAFSALARFGVPHSPKMLVALAAVAIIGLAALAIAATRRRRAAGAPDVEALPLDARDARADLVSRAGFAFIFSGAFGNLVDRIVRGYVVDFIHVWRWPVFNVADIAVVVGGLLLLVARLLRTRSTSAPGPSA